MGAERKRQGIRQTGLRAQRFQTSGGETEKDVPAAPLGHFGRRAVRQPKFFQDMPGQRVGVYRYFQRRQPAERARRNGAAPGECMATQGTFPCRQGQTHKTKFPLDQRYRLPQL